MLDAALGEPHIATTSQQEEADVYETCSDDHTIVASTILTPLESDH